MSPVIYETAQIGGSLAAGAVAAWRAHHHRPTALARLERLERAERGQAVTWPIAAVVMAALVVLGVIVYGDATRGEAVLEIVRWLLTTVVGGLIVDRAVKRGK